MLTGVVYGLQQYLVRVVAQVKGVEVVVEEEEGEAEVIGVVEVQWEGEVGSALPEGVEGLILVLGRLLVRPPARGGARDGGGGRGGARRRVVGVGAQ